MRDYDGTKYLLLFGLHKYDAIYDRFSCRIGLKSSITYVFSYNFWKIKIDSYDDLTIEETITLHDVITLIESVFSISNSLLLLIS